MVLLGDAASAEDCKIAIGKIEAALRKKLPLKGVELMISASVGHAVYPDDGLSEDQLIRAADASMYRVKSGHAWAH